MGVVGPGQEKLCGVEDLGLKAEKMLRGWLTWFRPFYLLPLVNLNFEIM